MLKLTNRSIPFLALLITSALLSGCQAQVPSETQATGIETSTSDIGKATLTETTPDRLSSQKFSYIRGLSVGDDESIFISDQAQFSVIHLDSLGNELGRAGNKGEGPGEYRNGPGPIAWHNGTVVTADFSTSFIHVYDDSFKRIDTFNTPSAVMNVAIMGNGNIMASFVSPPGMQRTIGIYDTTGAQLSTVSLPEHENHPLFDLPLVHAQSSGIVAAGYVYRNNLYTYDTSFEPKSEFYLPNTRDRAKSREDNVPPGYGMNSVPEANMLRDITSTRDYILVLAGAYAPNPRRDIYVFDPDGTVQGVITLDEEARYIAGSPSTNSFYASAADETGLKKYRFSLSNSEIASRLEK